MDCDFLKKFIDEHSLFLLNWAKDKTGDGEAALDLSQTVWLQFFHAVRVEEERGCEVLKPDNFFWKIARYVWLSYLSEKKSCKNQLLSIEEFSFQLSDERAGVEYRLKEDDETKNLISYMRKTVMRLNYLQREILISFYVDQKSQKEIAEKLGTSVSNVKWHLFDARKKIKKEIDDMEKMENDKKNSGEFLYRPRRLNMAINGMWTAEMDTNKINDSLLKQNICLACYEKSRSLDELNELLGVPKPYLEDDLHWLVQREFLSRNAGRYQTLFSIENSQSSQDIYGIFLRHREWFSDVIVDSFLKAENEIKNAGFYGSDKSIDKLLWFLIYWLCFDFDLFDVWYNPEPPVRPDGGRYFPLGFERLDEKNVKVFLDVSGWSMNGPMASEQDYSGRFVWYGLYNFGQSEIIDVIMRKFSSESHLLYSLLSRILSCYDGKDFDFEISALDGREKETLALLVKKGFVTLKEGRAYPAFCVLNAEQKEKLLPLIHLIIEKVRPELNKMMGELGEYYDSRIPHHLRYMKDFYVHQALCDLGWFTTLLAFNDGKLYIPTTEQEGSFLTLLFIKK